MKHWQVAALAVLLGVAAGLVVKYPPVSRPIQPESDRASGTPTPTATATPDHRQVTLLFAGDVMLARAVGDLMVAKQDWSWPFAKIASVTAAADLMFANLETTISTRGIKGGCGFCFRADPRAIQGLVKAGFDVMSVANNHIWDYGPEAFTDTLAALATADISAVGGGRDQTEARAGVVRTVRGVRIAYLAFTNLLPASAGAGTDKPGVNEFESGRMKEDIATARAKADVVVVSFHAGTEYETTHNLFQEQTYHAAIDAGADLVVGHHPHVVQEIEHYKNGWIAYSLGNFVFDQNFSDQTKRGMMLSVTVQDGQVTSAEPIPVSISGQYQPSVATP